MCAIHGMHVWLWHCRDGCEEDAMGAAEMKKWACQEQRRRRGGWGLGLRGGEGHCIAGPTCLPCGLLQGRRASSPGGWASWCEGSRASQQSCTIGTPISRTNMNMFVQCCRPEAEPNESQSHVAARAGLLPKHQSNVLIQQTSEQTRKQTTNKC